MPSRTRLSPKRVSKKAASCHCPARHGRFVPSRIACSRLCPPTTMLSTTSRSRLLPGIARCPFQPIGFSAGSRRFGRSSLRADLNSTTRALLSSATVYDPVCWKLLCLNRNQLDQFSLTISLVTGCSPVGRFGARPGQDRAGRPSEDSAESVELATSLSSLPFLKAKVQAGLHLLPFSFQPINPSTKLTRCVSSHSFRLPQHPSPALPKPSATRSSPASTPTHRSSSSVTTTSSRSRRSRSFPAIRSTTQKISLIGS